MTSGWTPSPYGHPPIPPAGYGVPPLPERSAPALKAFGVLSMVLAGLNGLGSALTVLQGALSDPRAPGLGSSGTPTAVDPMLQAITEYSETALKVGAIEGGAMMLMDVALFVIGLLLFQRREAGRVSASVWSVVAFAVLAGRAAVFEIVLWPKLARVMDGVGSAFSGARGMPGWYGLASGFAHGGTYVSLLFLGIFPTCLLIFMNLTSVKAQVRERGG